MPRDRQPAGLCDACHDAQVECSYNHFDDGKLRIDAWEHKCGSCGRRETRAFRSDEPDDLPSDPTICPFCDRKAGQALD